MTYELCEIGMQRCKIWGEKTVNPYIAEIDGVWVEQVICSVCYRELCNDI